MLYLFDSLLKYLSISLLLTGNINAIGTAVYYSNVKIISEDQLSLKWLCKQYTKTRSFYKLQQVQLNKDFYSDMVQEHIDYLKNKNMKTNGILSSGSSKRLFVLTLFNALTVLISKKIDASTYTLAKIIGFLSLPFYIHTTIKLATYNKRLNKRINRYVDILSCLQHEIHI
ncbi:MAG: hypothetical protein ACOYT8_06785 [Candidatus Dependentiae bacterium]